MPRQMRVGAASSAAVFRQAAAEAAAAAGMLARGIVRWSLAQEMEKVSGANLPKKQVDICEYLQPENADGPFQLPGGTTSRRSPQGISAAAVELCLVHSVLMRLCGGSERPGQRHAQEVQRPNRASRCRLWLDLGAFSELFIGASVAIERSSLWQSPKVWRISRMRIVWKYASAVKDNCSSASHAC